MENVKTVVIDGEVYVPDTERVREQESEDETWTFLKAPRFWAMVIGAVSVYLESKGLIGEAERNLLSILAASFIGIRTIDRIGEQAGKSS